MGVFGAEEGEAGKVERAKLDGLGQRAQSAHLWRREAAGAERGVVGSENTGGAERAQIGLDPLEDRIGAGGRDLLRDNDPNKTGESGFAAAQGRRAA